MNKLRYLVRIWERDSREGEGLRPIVPVVVYHGRERGRIKTLQEDVLDLLTIRFEAVEEAVAEGVTAVTDTTILRQLHREAATAVTMSAFIEKLNALTDSA